MTTTEGTEEPLSIQQRLYPQTLCFGCGPINTKGLQLRSYAKDGVVVATFQPSPEHDAKAYDRSQTQKAHWESVTSVLL